MYLIDIYTKIHFDVLSKDWQMPCHTATGDKGSVVFVGYPEKGKLVEARFFSIDGTQFRDMTLTVYSKYQYWKDEILERVTGSTVKKRYFAKMDNADSFLEYFEFAFDETNHAKLKELTNFIVKQYIK